MLVLTNPTIQAAELAVRRGCRGIFRKQIKRWLVMTSLLAAALWAPPARAGGGLALRPYWAFRTEAPVVDVATGDVDGDGMPEVVAATSDGVVTVLGNDGHVAWRYEAGFPMDSLWVGELYGDGGAAEIAALGEIILVLTESQGVAWYPCGVIARGLVAVDLNGDGRPEAVTGHSDGYIVVFDPKSGSFEKHGSFGPPVVDLWAGEIDGDGRPELVPTVAGGHDVVVLEDDLTTAWTRQIPGEVSLAQPGDLDGDGRAEVVTLSADWKLYVFKGDGSLAWQTESLSAGGDAPAPALGQLLVQDLNGDGRAEIIVVTPGTPAMIHVFDGRGGRVWGHALEAVSKPGRLAADDINGDGQAEVLVSSEGQEQAYLLTSSGERLAEFSADKTTGALAYADLNGDGRGEIIVGTETGVQVFGASNQIAWRELWRSPRLSGAVTATYLTDVSGDGRAEVAAGTDNGRVYLLSQAGKILWKVDLGELVRALSAGDVDGDDRREIVAATSDVVAFGKGQLHLLDGEQRRWSAPVDGYVNSLAVHDLNGDGRAEIIAGGEARSRGRVQVLDGSGVVLWGREFDEPVTAVAGDGSHVWAGTRGGRVYRLAGAASAGTAIGGVLEEYDLGAEVLSLGGGMAATADGRVVRLGGNGPSLARDLGGGIKRVTVGRDWTAWLDEGGVNLLAGGGSLRRGTLDGKGISLAAGDPNADGRIEVAAGTDQARVYLMGMGLDQPPMLTGPDLAETRSGYVYSVAVNDPDGDAVPITLEIWDPSAGVWLSQPSKSLSPGVGQGWLTWQVTAPFDTWDSGRESRFRFDYEFGGGGVTTPEIGGPLSIPTTPPALYYGQRAGLAALLLLVPGLGLLLYRRQRAYRRSPAGQAEATLQQLRSSPEVVAPRLRALARDDSLQLASLPGLARQAGQIDVADLSEGFHLMATHPQVAGEGLRSAVDAMQRLHAARAEPASGMLAVYELLQRLLEANTPAGIVALQPQLDRAARLDPREGVEEDLPDLDQVADALAKLDGVARTLHNYQRVDLVEDKVTYLAEAIEALSRLEREFRAELSPPERNVLSHIAAYWLTLTSRALHDLQGRAQLEVTLRTRQVMPAGMATLALELTNTGRSPASNVRVTLAPGQDGHGERQAEGDAARVDILPAGRSAIVEIPFTAAPWLDQFRAEFSITFDDHERNGKTLAFADLVHLMRPGVPFQPIPNPYAPGKPLAPGSRLFFGREDLFQFIAENMHALAHQNILVLTGQRRMGKTSFLQQLPARLGENYVPVTLDGQSLGIDPGMANFFYDMALAITDALIERGYPVAKPQPEAFRERPSAAFERAFLPAAFEAIGGRHLLLLLDEFEELEMRVASGKLEPTLFPFFRHLMQHGGKLGFVFVGTHHLDALSADYWSIFFNIALYKHVGALDDKAARELMVEPAAGYGLRYDDLAVDKVLRMTAGHPYFLQLSCHALVNHANRERRDYLTIQDVNHVLGEIIELGEAHFAFMWEESNPSERLVLATLTRLLSQELAATAAQVAELLATRRVSLSAPEVACALEELMERDIVRGLRGQPPRYDYKVGLFNLWIERHKALGQVIEGVGFFRD
jgi:hypothetical protein